MDSFKDVSHGHIDRPNKRESKDPRFPHARFIPTLLSLSLLAACGSSGDGSSNSPNPSGNSNRSPVITVDERIKIPEQMRLVTALSATDLDGDKLDYSILGGADAGLFALSSNGNLEFISAPNFEAPTDADADNIYDVSVRVSDGVASDSASIKVEVVDRFEGRVGDAPIVGAQVFIDINSNLIMDGDEPQAITTSSGQFVLFARCLRGLYLKKLFLLVALIKTAVSRYPI